MGQAWEVVIDLWETGNRWARATIVFVFAPPLGALLLAFLGLKAWATATALAPLLVLIFAPLALLDPLVIVVVAGALGLHPTAAAVRQWLARWIPLYIGSVLTYGVYLFYVPISNNPVLVLPLVGAVGAMAFFAISGVRGTVVRWATRVLAVTAIAITVAFFFGGKPKEKAAEVAAQAGVGVSQTAVAGGEEFILNAGEEVFTVLVGTGTHHRIRANKPWLALSRDDQSGTYEGPGGKYRPERHGTLAVWNGAGPEAPLLIRGLEDGTKIRFERIER